MTKRLSHADCEQDYWEYSGGISDVFTQRIKNEIEDFDVFWHSSIGRSRACAQEPHVRCYQIKGGKKLPCLIRFGLL
jgi:hypothetical protein